MAFRLDVSMSNSEIAVSQKLLVWLVWNEKESNQLHTQPAMWPCPFTIHVDIGLNLSEFEITVSQEWESRLTWNGCESTKHDHYHDLSVTFGVGGCAGKWPVWLQMSYRRHHLFILSSTKAPFIKRKYVKQIWIYGMDKVLHPNKTMKCDYLSMP